MYDLWNPCKNRLVVGRALHVHDALCLVYRCVCKWFKLNSIFTANSIFHASCMNHLAKICFGVAATHAFAKVHAVVFLFSFAWAFSRFDFLFERENPFFKLPITWIHFVPYNFRLKVSITCSAYLIYARVYSLFCEPGPLAIFCLGVDPKSHLLRANCNTTQRGSINRSDMQINRVVNLWKIYKNSILS